METATDYTTLMNLVESELAQAPLNDLCSNAALEYLLMYHPARETLQLDYLAGLVVHESPRTGARRLYAVRVRDVTPDGPDAHCVVSETDYISLPRCARNKLKPQDAVRLHQRLLNEAFYNALRPWQHGIGRVTCAPCDMCETTAPLLLVQQQLGQFEKQVDQFLAVYDRDAETIELQRTNFRLTLRDAQMESQWRQFYGRPIFACLACQPHGAPPPRSPGRLGEQAAIVSQLGDG